MPSNISCTSPLTVESLGKTRYKVVVQTTIGQYKDQGIRVTSRCLWDSTTDNYASCNYSNVSIHFFSVVMKMV